MRKSALCILEQPVQIHTVNSNIEILSILAEKIPWKNVIDKNKLSTLEETYMSLFLRKLKELLRFDAFYKAELKIP